MRIRYSMIVVALAGLVVSAPPAAAVPLTMYQVSLDTSALGAGVFGLDVQLTDGSGTDDGNSTVTLSNVNFGGGSAIGAPTLAGGATGDVIAGASLTDSASSTSSCRTSPRAARCRSRWVWRLMGRKLRLTSSRWPFST